MYVSIREVPPPQMIHLGICLITLQTTELAIVTVLTELIDHIVELGVQQMQLRLVNNIREFILERLK